MIINKTVVRNQAYTRSSCGVRERHNERKNESYYNADIQLERVPFNVHFKQSEDTYEQAFDKLLADGFISTRGLKQDGSAKIIDEMIFDVNTSYFEQNGGYDFAKKFYEEAYQLAVKEIGDERYILSAVMHADERNKAVSEELGRDVYHYHLHVVYVPVVEKEIKWTKRCKDKDLVGKVKEVIQQVSHSKKWPKFKDDDGNWVNSYSLLQDRYFKHMKSAGFKDFERGDYKSTRKHLSVEEYKVQQEQKRSAELGNSIKIKENTSAKLDRKIGTQKRVDMQKSEFSKIGKKATFTDEIKLTPKEFSKLKRLARTGIEVQNENDELHEELTKIKFNYNQLQHAYNGLQDRFDKLWDDFRKLRDKAQPFFDAVKFAPERIKSVVSEVLEQRKQRKRERGMDDGTR